MPDSVATREAIERAAAAARVRVLAMRSKTLQTLKSLIYALAGDIRDELEQFGGPDGRIPATLLPTVRAFLEGRLSTFSDRWRRLIDEGITEAARIGASLLELVGRTGGDAQLVGQVVEYIRTFRAADGLQLSDRIWRANNATRDSLRAAIEGAIARGESSSQAAARYLRDGLPVPGPLQAGIAAAQPGAIGRSVLELLAKNAPGDPTFNLQRLLRTEINRAYTESYVATVAQHPDVIGVKFNLSPNHPRTDVCDLHAAANVHGLGAGVYPPGNHPYPAHPQTLSFLTTVFADQVTEADRAGQQTPFEWLRRQPSDAQDLILGGKRKGFAFRNGDVKESELRVPWYRIEARLKAEGKTP